MTNWFVDKINDDYLFLRSDESSGVGVEIWNMPDDLKVDDKVDIQWKHGQWNEGGLGETVRRVDWNGQTLVNMSDEYMDMKHKLTMYEIRMKNERRAFLNYDKNRQRIANLIEPLRNRLNRLLREDPSFEKESMGLEYELFICEQAQMLYETSQDAIWQNKMAVEFNCTPTPNDALDEWWSLNSQKHDYNYQRQYELIPAWDNGHSGMTASVAYQFARLLNNGETNF